MCTFEMHSYIVFSFLYRCVVNINVECTLCVRYTLFSGFVQMCSLVSINVDVQENYRITGYFRRSLIFKFFEEHHSYENASL